MEKIAAKHFNDFLLSDEYKDLRKEFSEYIEFTKIRLNGRTLKRVRKEREISQAKLGEIIGKKQNTILKYEMGILKINVKVWEEIIKELGIKREELLIYFKEEKDNALAESDSLVGDKLLSILFESVKKEVKNEKLAENIRDFLFELIDQFFSDSIENFIQDILFQLFPFEILQDELSDNFEIRNLENLSLPVIEKVKNDIETIKDVNKKNLLKIKLKKIEKDLNEFAIFLLKQNGFL